MLCVGKPNRMCCNVQSTFARLKTRAKQTMSHCTECYLPCHTLDKIQEGECSACKKTSWTHCIDILIQFWPSPVEEDVIRMLLEVEEQLIIDEDFIIEEEDGIAGTQ